MRQRRPLCDCAKNVFILPNPGLQRQRFQVCVAKCCVPRDQPSTKPSADSEIPREESSSSSTPLSNCRKAGPNFSVVLTCVTVTPARVHTTTHKERARTASIRLSLRRQFRFRGRQCETRGEIVGHNYMKRAASEIRALAFRSRATASPGPHAVTTHHLKGVIHHLKKKKKKSGEEGEKGRERKANTHSVSWPPQFSG